MDEHWAAIVVAVVSGLFGLVGLIFTQYMAKWKTNQIKPTANDVIAASEGYVDRTRLDYLAIIKQELQVQTRLMEDNFRDVKDGLRDISSSIRHEAADIKLDLDRLERRRSR